MKLVGSLHVLVNLLLCMPVLAQNIISFDDQGWSSDQSLDSNFTIGNFLYSSNKNFYTNYGYNFDVYSTSIYFVFQNPAEDQFTVTTINNELVKLNSIAVYQVSESSTDTLIIEGWNGSSKIYSQTFSNITTWQILTLNYDNINKIIFKLANSGYIGLTDFNFDNFLFNDPLLSVALIEVPNYTLSQNYPNPFNPSTVINYQVAKPSKVILKVYDIIGNEITTLVNEYKDAGSYSVTFSASGGNIRDLPSGMYIYKLVTDSFVSSKKMMLIK